MRSRPRSRTCRRRIESLEIEAGIIDREAAVGVNVGTRKSDVDEKLGHERERLGGLEKRWQEEKGIVDKVLALRAQLRGEDKPVDRPAAGEGGSVVAPADGRRGRAPIDREKVLAELHEAQAQLEALQGDSPLIMPSVDAQAVASVVADWTGIPVGRMVKNELQAILQLGEIPRQAGDRPAARPRHDRQAHPDLARPLDNPNKPIGVFMLCGTSGVGKTETALALAEALYGGEQNVITINMSEFQEAHTVSSLKGAPPGYVGYGEGGILTEAVRRGPYSVVLLDEVEKAHPDVHELFFQVFDKGRMEDGEGRMIDFKNTIILLTSNAGSELVMNMCKDPELAPDPESLATALAEPLQKIFPPALLGRLVVIPYYPLSDEMLGQIVRLQLNRIKKRRRREPQDPVRVQRRGGQADRQALQQRGIRRPDHRRDPHQHRAAQGLDRVLVARGRGQTSSRRCASASPKTTSPTPSSKAPRRTAMDLLGSGADATLSFEAEEGTVLRPQMTGHEHLGRCTSTSSSWRRSDEASLNPLVRAGEARARQADRHAPRGVAARLRRGRQALFHRLRGSRQARREARPLHDVRGRAAARHLVHDAVEGQQGLPGKVGQGHHQRDPQGIRHRRRVDGVTAPTRSSTTACSTTRRTSTSSTAFSRSPASTTTSSTRRQTHKMVFVDEIGSHEAYPSGNDQVERRDEARADDHELVRAGGSAHARARLTEYDFLAEDEQERRHAKAEAPKMLGKMDWFEHPARSWSERHQAGEQTSPDAAESRARVRRCAGGAAERLCVGHRHDQRARSRHGMTFDFEATTERQGRRHLRLVSAVYRIDFGDYESIDD
jgi:hypothetical protein